MCAWCADDNGVCVWLLSTVSFFNPSWKLHLEHYALFGSSFFVVARISEVFKNVTHIRYSKSETR